MMKGMLLCSRGSWRYQRNRLGAAQEILLVSRPVGLELVIFLKETKRNRPVRASSHTRYFFSFLFFRAPHSTVSMTDFTGFYKCVTRDEEKGKSHILSISHIYINRVSYVALWRSTPQNILQMDRCPFHIIVQALWYGSSFVAAPYNQHRPTSHSNTGTEWYIVHGSMTIIP